MEKSISSFTLTPPPEPDRERYATSDPWLHLMAKHEGSECCPQPNARTPKHAQLLLAQFASSLHVGLRTGAVATIKLNPQITHGFNYTQHRETSSTTDETFFKISISPNKSKMQTLHKTKNDERRLCGLNKLGWAILPPQRRRNTVSRFATVCIQSYAVMSKDNVRTASCRMGNTTPPRGAGGETRNRRGILSYTLT